MGDDDDVDDVDIGDEDDEDDEDEAEPRVDTRRPPFAVIDPWLPPGGVQASSSDPPHASLTSALVVRRIFALRGWFFLRFLAGDAGPLGAVEPVSTDSAAKRRFCAFAAAMRARTRAWCVSAL